MLLSAEGVVAPLNRDGFFCSSRTELEMDCVHQRLVPDVANLDLAVRFTLDPRPESEDGGSVSRSRRR